MTVTIIGGSAHSTPVLMEWLAEQHQLAATLTIRLVGRNAERLSAVRRACCLLAPGMRVAQFDMPRIRHALQQSDIVLIQVRAGGYAGRAFDECFPLSHGIPGDEGLGPGGLSAALRAWPLVRELLSECLRVADKATILLLTSPGSILVRLAAMEFPGSVILGICELPFTTLTHVCNLAGCRSEETTFGYAGVNHLGWIYNVHDNERDLVALYASHSGVSMRHIVTEYQAIPLKYLRLHFDRELAVNEQIGILPRATQLARWRDNSLEAFSKGTPREIRDSLKTRDASWYTQAIGPFIAATAEKGSSSRPFFRPTRRARLLSEPTTCPPVSCRRFQCPPHPRLYAN